MRVADRTRMAVAANLHCNCGQHPALPSLPENPQGHLLSCSVYGTTLVRKNPADNPPSGIEVSDFLHALTETLAVAIEEGKPLDDVLASSSVADGVTAGMDASAFILECVQRLAIATRKNALIRNGEKADE